MVKRRRTPAATQLIAISYFLGAALSILAGIFVLSFLAPIASLLEGYLAFAFYLLIFIGIMLVGSSVLGFYIGLGLQKGKKWARIAGAIFAGLGLLFSLILLAVEPSTGIASSVVPGLIFWYLVFSKEAKTFFKK